MSPTWQPSLLTLTRDSGLELDAESYKIKQHTYLKFIQSKCFFSCEVLRSPAAPLSFNYRLSLLCGFWELWSTPYGLLTLNFLKEYSLKLKYATASSLEQMLKHEVLTRCEVKIKSLVRVIHETALKWRWSVVPLLGLNKCARHRCSVESGTKSRRTLKWEKLQGWTSVVIIWSEAELLSQSFTLYNHWDLWAETFEAPLRED